MRVVVVGGGVAGLGAALALSRDGHEVTVLERDPTDMPADPDAAFEWDRRGAPQVRHSHAFLARLYVLLRDRYPDVLAALLAAGATEMPIGHPPPPGMVGFEAEPGDADLVMLACRRTTFEWVLRRIVLGAPHVAIETGVETTGLTTAVDEPTGLARVTGVRVADRGARRAEQPADLVVVATGRRSALPDWLAAHGVGPVPEQAEDTGIVYSSRFYRLRPTAARPTGSGIVGGDLGYLKYGVFVGDNRTFSVTLAVPTADTTLRAQLADSDRFELTAGELVPTKPWVEPGRADPITPVHLMGGLINRLRRFVVDGRPLVLGVQAIGDARVCTNPLYGRGCTTAFWSADLLAEALRAHPGDDVAQAIEFDRAIDTHLLPWYRASVESDAQARRVAAALLAGENPDGDPNDPGTFMRSVLREGLLPAMRTDPVVMRAFFRSFNLLVPPDALLADPDVTGRVLAAWQDRASRPADPALGPPRDELLALLAALAA